MRKHPMITQDKVQVRGDAFTSNGYSGKQKLITHRVVNHQEPTVTGRECVRHGNQH
jgi:hypothetical protein